MSNARGFWKGGELWWCIGSDEISDRDLRLWVYHNMDGRYVGPCVLQMHTDAFANRNS